MYNWRMEFFTIAKKQIEDTIKSVEETARISVVDWRLEIPGEGDTPVDFVAILEDGINMTVNVEPLT